MCWILPTVICTSALCYIQDSGIILYLILLVIDNCDNFLNAVKEGDDMSVCPPSPFNVGMFPPPHILPPKLQKAKLKAKTEEKAIILAFHEANIKWKAICERTGWGESAVYADFIPPCKPVPGCPARRLLPLTSRFAEKWWKTELQHVNYYYPVNNPAYLTIPHTIVTVPGSKECFW